MCVANPKYLVGVMMFRVLLLNWRDMGNPLAGGAEVHVWKVFGHLASQGWDVAAICASFSGGRRNEIVDGIQVHRCGGPYHYGLALPLAYRRVAGRFRPHLVVDFMNKLPLLTPLFVRRPLVCFVHHLFGNAAFVDAGLAAGTVVRGSEKLVRPVYAHTPCLAGSPSAKAELAAIGLPLSNLFVVPYGTDTEFYKPGERSPKPMIVYVGRLKRYKGVADLLAVVPRLLESFPTMGVKIAGQGDAEDELRCQARNLKVDHRVEFCGFVSEEEKRRLYQQAWVSCFPSAKEGFGLTVPEAAMCGTPTVGYDVPGLRDAIEDHVTGLLVPPGDKHTLGEALHRILADTTLRDALSRNGLRRYAEFSWENSANRTKDVLEQLMRERWPGAFKRACRDER